MIQENKSFQNMVQEAPTLTEESVMFHPELFEDKYPNLKRTVHLVRQFERAKPKNRKVLLDQFANSIIKDPQLIIDMAENLSLLDVVKPDINSEPVKTGLIASVEDVTRRRPTSWQARAIEKLIKIGLDKEDETRDFAVRIQKAMFNSASTPEDAIDVEYQAAWAMLTTDDADVKNKLEAILCFKTNVFAADSMAAYLYGCGNGLTDDTHIRRFFSTNQAINEVAKANALAARKINSISEDAVYRTQMVEFAFSVLPKEEQIRRSIFINKLKQKYARRYQRYQDAADTPPPINPSSSPFFLITESDFSKQAEAARQRRESTKNLPWPENLCYGFEDPLDLYIEQTYSKRVQHTAWEHHVHDAIGRGYQKLTDRPIKLDDDLELEIVGKGYDTPEQKANLVRSVYNAILEPEFMQQEGNPLSKIAGALEAARELDGLTALRVKGMEIMFSIAHQLSENKIGRLSSIIQYHRPTISIEQAEKINEELPNLRRHIKDHFTKAIGKRGFEILISDPALIGLGYHSITFKQEDGNKYLTSLNILGHDYSFSLDPDFRIDHQGDIKSFDTVQDQAWLEIFTLSHLERVLCSGNDELDKELVGNGKQEAIYKKQTLGRIEHLRRLPVGQHYSNDSFLRCLSSTMLIKDLTQINKLRASINYGGTPESGMWTYVSPVEKTETSNSTPVRVSYKNASRAIRDVLPLGEYTEEELARVEQQVLAELGVF